MLQKETTRNYFIRNKTRVKNLEGDHAISFKLYLKENEKDIFISSNLIKIKPTTETQEITDEICILSELNFLRGKYVN